MSASKCRSCGRKQVYWNTIRVDETNTWRVGGPTSTYARCANCHEYESLGPSNDAPIEVAVEIRAAELADLAGSHSTTTEAYGWLGYQRDTDPIYFGGVTDHWQSGWLGRAIHDHDQEQGQ